MRISVYTIALNEVHHVERWAQSVADADYLIVGDTGSTDNTQEILLNNNIFVLDIRVKPWRFDDARNAVLAAIPDDIDVCISMDMDEYMEPGWRAELEAAWVPGTTRLNYTYQFDAISGHKFMADKIHSRWGYRWQRPVHETVFSTTQNEIVATNPAVIMSQIQDRTKTTRHDYLPLLEVSHRENPTDSQTLFWYARDLMYAGRFPDAINKLQEYLELPTSNWSVERSEAMRYLAKMQPEKTVYWLWKANQEIETRRETWCDLAEHYYVTQDWANCYWACHNALTRSQPTGSYLDDQGAWGSKIWDLGSIACFYLKMREQANTWIDTAITIEPTNERLLNNREFIRGIE